MALAFVLMIALPGLALAKVQPGDGELEVSGALEQLKEEASLISAAEKLEWTWLAAGSTVFLGAAAGLTAMDARVLERDLHEMIDVSSKRPVSGAAMVDLVVKTERRALQASVLWGAAALGALATVGLLHLELVARDETKAPSLGLSFVNSGLTVGKNSVIRPGLLLEWRIP